MGPHLTDAAAFALICFALAVLFVGLLSAAARAVGS